MIPPRLQVQKTNTQTGAAAIYLVLLLTFMFTSSALIISFSLTRQLRATNEIADSARAFYAATSGIEQGLMQLVTDPGDDNTVIIDDIIEYEGEEASFTGTARLVESQNNPSVLLPCVFAEGEFRSQQRRAELGGLGVGCVD